MAKSSLFLSGNPGEKYKLIWGITQGEWGRLVNRAINAMRVWRSTVCLSAVGIMVAASPAQALTGVVVESLQPDGVAEKSGFQVGDVLGHWGREGDDTRPAGGGDIVTIADWTRVVTEELPRGRVRVDLVRAGEERLTLDLRTGLLGIELRPRMTGSVLDVYEATRGELERTTGSDGEFAGVAPWRRIAADMEGAGVWPAAWWLEIRAGAAAADAQRPVEAEACFTHAVELAQQAGGGFVEAWTRRELGEFFQDVVQAEAARTQFDLAESLLRLEPGETVTLGVVLGRIARMEELDGDPDAATRLYDESLGILERLAPQSLETASCLHAMGSMAHRRGRYSEAEDLYLRALALRTQLAPGSVLVGFTSNNLGLLGRHQGDLEAADRYLTQALELKERARPGSVTVAHTYNNLGLVATARGHLATAEGHFGRALEIYRKEAPESRHPGTVLNNLAEVQIQRHRWLDARNLLEEALAIHQQADRDSVSAARTLGNLGFVCSEFDDLDAAERNYRRALEIFQVHAPDGLDVAKIENNLGEIAERRDDIDGAVILYLASLEKKRRVAPGSVLVANTLATVSGLQRELGNDDAAAIALAEALALAEVLAPGSKMEARILHKLGVLRRDNGDIDGALGFFRRAIDALESQIGLLGGGDEARAGYRADHMDYYHDLIDLLLEAGRQAEAFHVLERSRAQVLLAMLAERDVVFGLDVPPDLDRRRRLNGVATHRVRERLADLSRNESDEISAGTEELLKLRREHEEIRQSIRRSSPRLAALAYPEPLDLAAAGRAIEAGTVVLSYSVGADRTHLFALDGSGSLRVETIDSGERDLRDAVSLFRGLIEAGRGSSEDRRVLIDAGKSLYDRLIAPVEDSVSAAERLLIVPDGVLHLLPFSALVHESPDGDRYLVQSKPIASVVSLTVFDQIRSDPRSSPTTSVVAFADPVYRITKEIAAGDGGLASLPGSRAEAEAIAELYDDAATTWLGSQATETRSRQLPRDTSIVHFAAHVVIAESSPLDSAIALSTPIGDEIEDGLLQAWEVLESVRIDAELVTLSGCQTAMGAHVAGEGLIGLTRAFQYAGARSVLASLWRVEDRTTAEFMRRFYSRLREGRSKDAALRYAQLDLIQGPITLSEGGDGVLSSIGTWVRGLFGVDNGDPVDASHPFFWAAFKVEGDWK